jgi:DNA-binding winged helix-turn-helix (wHTH) protein
MAARIGKSLIGKVEDRAAALLVANQVRINFFSTGRGAGTPLARRRPFRYPEAMNVERKVGRRQIGGWEFSETSGELRRLTDVRRLEPRAAKALQMLCDADGDVVSQEQLIDEVWGGRALSDNSVAVVIGQLRKALDDDAREPRIIETIPKRGYRLRVDPAASADPSGRRTMLVLGAVLAILGEALGAYLSMRPAVMGIAVSDVANETGNPTNDPLARATSELNVT